MSDLTHPAQDDSLQSFVDELYGAFRSRQFLRPGSKPIDSLTLDQAYDVQSRVIARRIEDGEKPVGYKVGCTSRAIREQFGLKEPVMGRLLAPFVFPENACLSVTDYVNCSVEPELVFRIGRDVSPEMIEAGRIIEAIDSVSPGIEIHNYTFWYGEPTRQELIASNGIHACLVVGSTRRDPEGLDLEVEGIGLFVNDELVTSGIGAEIMGGPLRSLEWLGRKLLSHGKALSAGDLVIPGSAVRLVPVAQGSMVEARFTYCGRVRAEFV